MPPAEVDYEHRRNADVLLQRTRDPDPTTRLEAARLLRRIALHDPELDYPDSDLRREMIRVREAVIEWFVVQQDVAEAEIVEFVDRQVREGPLAGRGRRREPRRLTFDQACRRLRVSQARLLRMIESGELRVHWEQGCVRFDPEDVRLLRRGSGRAQPPEVVPPEDGAEIDDEDSGEILLVEEDDSEALLDFCIDELDDELVFDDDSSSDFEIKHVARRATPPGDLRCLNRLVSEAEGGLAGGAAPAGLSRPAPPAAPSPIRMLRARRGSDTAKMAPPVEPEPAGAAEPGAFPEEPEPPARGRRQSRRRDPRELLSPEAGRPGPLERTLARSLLLLRTLQATIGLRVVLLVHAADRAVDTLAGYVTGIYRTWKLLYTAQRRIARGAGNREALLADLARGTRDLGRLFSLPGHELTAETTAPTFPLALVIDLRGHLDQMQRDLDLLTARQAVRLAGKTAGDLLASVVPSPLAVLRAVGDLLILAWFMRHGRDEIEQMVRQLEAVYQQLGDGRTADASVAEARRHLRRLIALLCNPAHAIYPRHWRRAELLAEHVVRIEQDRPCPHVVLELDRWLTARVARALRRCGYPVSEEEARRRAREARTLRERCRLARRLRDQLL